MAEKSISFIYKILDQFSGPLDHMGKKIEDSTKHLGLFGKAVGAILTAGGIEELGSKAFEFGKQSLEAFEKAEVGVALLKNTLNNLKGTGRPTFEELEKSADKLSRNSLFTKTSIMTDSFGALVKYSAVGKFGIDQVSLAAQNMAFSINKNATGGDLANASNVLGRALQNPFVGANILMRRYHIAFTNQDMLLMQQYKKTNNEVAARQFLFDKLANAPGVKGAMSAIEETSEGRRMKILKNIQEIQVKLGETLAPIVDKVLELAVKAMPLLQNAFEIIKPVIGFVADLLINTFELIDRNKLVFGILAVGLAAFAISANAAAIGATILNLRMNLAALSASGWTIQQWLLNIALDANPIGLIVIAVTALAVGMTLLILHWKQFTNLLREKPAFNLIGLILPIVTIPILIIAHWNAVKRMFGEVVDYIKLHWKDLLITLAGPIGLAIEIIKHWKNVALVIGDVFGIFNKGGLAKLQGDFKNILGPSPATTTTPIMNKQNVNVNTNMSLTAYTQKGITVQPMYKSSKVGFNAVTP